MLNDVKIVEDVFCEGENRMLDVPEVNDDTEASWFDTPDLTSKDDIREGLAGKALVVRVVSI